MNWNIFITGLWLMIVFLIALWFANSKTWKLYNASEHNSIMGGMLIFMIAILLMVLGLVN